MVSMVPESNPLTPRERAEIPRPTMAKANLRKAETRDYRPDIGRAITRARLLLELSLKELAAKVDRDPRQVARWENGSERPQLDALWALEEFRVPLVQAFAEQCKDSGVEVRTVITLRQKVG